MPGRDEIRALFMQERGSDSPGQEKEGAVRKGGTDQALRNVQARDERWVASRRVIRGVAVYCRPG